MSLSRSLQYLFLAIIVTTVGFSLYQWNASRAAVKLQQSTSVNLTNGLVGYWSFDGDDISGTTAYDRSGSGNNGTLTNGPTRTAGRIGQALNFDGVDDKLTVSSNVIGSGAASICTWVNPRSMGGGGYGRIVNSMNGAANKTILYMEYPAPRIGFSSDGSTVLTSTSVISYSQWTHVCATRDASGNGVIYLNGVSSATGTTGTPGAGANVTYIGNTYDGSRTFDGVIDEPRIYNRALSAGEIQSLYDLGNPDKVSTAQGDPLEQGLVGYWKLDDVSGTSATDSSGNGSTGTLTNGPTWGTGKVKGALNFVRANGSYTATTFNPNVVLGTGPFSISLWANSTTLGTDGGTDYRTFLGASGTRFYLRTVGSGITFGIGAGTMDCSAGLTTGNWYHVVGTFNGTSAAVYVNGVPVSCSGSGLSTPYANFAIPIGTMFSGAGTEVSAGRFDGSIDEVRIYNRALSAEEVTKLYRETVPDNPDTGLVGYWPFNGKDISGTTAYDRSGSGNNGTLTNGPTRTAGRIGQALSFDGVNQYVTTGNTTAFDNLFSSGTSLCAWANFPNFTNYNRLITIENNAGTDYDAWIQTQQSSAIVQFGAGGTGKFKTSTTALSANTWYYLCGVTDYTAGGTKIFINGLEDSGTLGGTPTYTSDKGTFDVGRLRATSSSLYGTGQIDEPRVYNRALSAGEVQSLYDLGNPDKVNTPQGDPLEQGLVGYWKLDDASGTSATDSSGNANTGTLTNGPTWGTGRIKGDTVFDGVNDYVQNNVSKTAIGGNLSISFWVQPTGSQSTVGVIQIADALSSNSPWIFLQRTDATTVQWYINGGYRMTQLVSDNIWYHMVLTYDGTTWRAFKNGVLDGTYVGVIGAASGNFTWLGNGYNGYFNGSLDEVRFYNRALSDDEVNKLYRETVPDNPDTGLVGYWPFNGKDISGTTAYDRSGKGNNGTLTNGPTRTAGRIGQALNFDGVDDYLSVSGTQSVQNVSYWVKPNASTYSKYSMALSSTKRYFLNNGLYSGTNTATRYINATTPTSESLGSEILTGTFESGSLGSWYRYFQGGASGNANFTASAPYAGTYSAVLNVFTGGSARSDAVFYDTTPRSITAGTLYKFQFAAKGSVAKNGLVAFLQQGGSPWRGINTNYTFDVTTSWVFHTFYFYADFTDSNIQSYFGAGGLGGFDLYLDNISLKPVTSVGDVTTGAWNFVSVNLDSPVTADNINLGLSSGLQNGSIDDVRIYNRALSATEVAALYSAGR